MLVPRNRETPLAKSIVKEQPILVVRQHGHARTSGQPRVLTHLGEQVQLTNVRVHIEVIRGPILGQSATRRHIRHTARAVGFRDERRHRVCAGVVVQQPELGITIWRIGDDHILYQCGGMIPRRTHFTVGCGPGRAVQHRITRDLYAGGRAVMLPRAWVGCRRSSRAVAPWKTHCHGGRGAAEAAHRTGGELR